MLVSTFLYCIVFGKVATFGKWHTLWQSKDCQFLSNKVKTIIDAACSTSFVIGISRNDIIAGFHYCIVFRNVLNNIVVQFNSPPPSV